MKKFLITMIAVVMMFQTTAFAGMFQGNFLDPFNNELFEVVAESEYYDDYNLDFVHRERVYNEDRSLAKVVEIVINYDGSHEINEICGYTDAETADYYVYGGDSEYVAPEYNDGLTRAGEEDGCWLGGYKDINNVVKFECVSFDYYNYKYNLGLLWESENNGYAGVDIPDREYRTVFTSVMTDNAVYEFNYRINPFNDDGYSLMAKDGKTYVLKLKKGIIPTVFYNNQKIAFDQIPVIENGRTLVPLRAIFETFGAEVGWDAVTDTVTATKDGTEVKLTINSNVAYKNGEPVNLDVPAKIVNGRTLVPVRFVSDCFDVKVEWDNVMSRVNLTK